MSREKALTIGYERPKDTEVLVNSLAQCCLNTASLFVMPVYKSVRECRYRSIQKLETRHVNLKPTERARSALSSRAGSLIFVLTSPPFSNHYVNGSGSITSVGEERANLSALVYL